MCCSAGRARGADCEHVCELRLWNMGRRSDNRLWPPMRVHESTGGSVVASSLDPCAAHQTGHLVNMHTRPYAAPFPSLC